MTPEAVLPPPPFFPPPPFLPLLRRRPLRLFLLLFILFLLPFYLFFADDLWGSSSSSSYILFLLSFYLFLVDALWGVDNLVNDLWGVVRSADGVEISSSREKKRTVLETEDRKTQSWIVEFCLCNLGVMIVNIPSRSDILFRLFFFLLPWSSFAMLFSSSFVEFFLWLWTFRREAIFFFRFSVVHHNPSRFYMMSSLIFIYLLAFTGA